MKNVNIITKHAKRDLVGEYMKYGFVEIEGQLEVFATKNGKVIHYDKGDNQVTIWAKHATMHLLTGEAFSTHGEQRLFDSGFNGDGTAHTAIDIGEGTNKDGTLLSGQQYFSNNSTPDFDIDSRWIKSTITPQQAIGDASGDPDSSIFPFFPSKMLFGTGFEWKQWNYDAGNPDAGIPDQYRTIYTNEGWDQSTFETNIPDPSNDYSNYWTGAGGTLDQTRTMNDIFSGPLEEEITDQDFGVKGAIKNGGYSDSNLYRGVADATPTQTPRTEERGGNEFLVRSWAGVGNPCFIYPTRELRFFQTGSEIALAYDDDNIENKITFQVVMPEQTGAEAGIFYPYNGYTLKQAGLFADARLLLNNTDPESNAAEAFERDVFRKMPYGLMYAKRNISPILKSHDVSVTSRWSLYL